MSRQPDMPTPPPRSATWVWVAVAAGAFFLWECLQGNSPWMRKILMPAAEAIVGAGAWLLGDSFPFRLIPIGLASLALAVGIACALPRKQQVVLMWLGSAVGVLMLAGWVGRRLVLVDSRVAASAWLLMVGSFVCLGRRLCLGDGYGRRPLLEWFRILLPGIGRELLSQSRRPSTYWGRVVAAGVLLGMGGLHVLRYGIHNGQGGLIFAALQLLVLLITGTLAPFLTADCVSRERREGTLDLLFLTPLRPGQVALAKWLAHAAKTVAFYLAVAPLLAVPILAGGVAWQDVAVSAVLSLLVIGWMLAIGVLTSSLGRNPVESLLVAALAGGFSVVLWLLAVGYGLALFEFVVQNDPQQGLSLLQIGHAWENSVGLLRGLESRWGGSSVVVFQPGVFWLSLACTTIFPLVGIALWLWLAGVLMRQTLWIRHPFTAETWWVTWGEHAAAPKDTIWQQEFRVPPVGLALGRNWMRRVLERDPVGWLGRRDSAACGLSWVSLALVVAIGLVAMMVNEELNVDFSAPAWFLIAAMSLMAAGGFRRERQTGMMELLLVTPVRERQMLHGFLRGLWAQARPAAVVLWGLWCWRMVRWGTQAEDWECLPLLVTLLALAVIGLYHSLRLRHFVVAWALTVVAGVGVPLLLGELTRMLVEESWFWNHGWISAAVVQGVRVSALLGITLVCYSRLCRLLAQRRFCSAES